MDEDLSDLNLTRLDLFDLTSQPNVTCKLIQGVELFPWEIWGYALVVPLICAVGIAANTLSLFVFFFGDLKETIYTYLTALSVADLLTVVLVLFSGISRGVGESSFFWAFVDAFLHIPIASVSTTLSILALVTVTLERLAIIKFPVASRRYCTPSIAKRNCWLITLFSVLFNIPYCFLFTIQKGQIIYSQFGSTRYYKIHNWIRLAILGFIPGIILLVSNVLLLLSLRRSRRRRISLMKPAVIELSDCASSSGVSSRSTYHIIQPKSNTLQPPTRRRYGKTRSRGSRHPRADKNQHRRVTVVLIAMICSFLIGEFPTHIASRSSAVSLIFPSQPHLFDERNFRIFKLTATILMCCHYSCNFFLYCAFNKRFIRELQRLWTVKIKPTFQTAEQNSAWNSETSNETFNKIVVVSHIPEKKIQNKRKRKLSSVTHVSFKIGLSKKIYRETQSNGDNELDKFSVPTSSL